LTDSIIWDIPPVDDTTRHYASEDDFSYVPCLTIDQARSTIRDTVLGLEYLHYQGIVHRDIKPANLLWTKDHRVKIADFGVSYFGRHIREGEAEEDVSEEDATDFDDDLELAKTVGTPAFFAPELCYTDLDGKQPEVTEQIDVWSLGVTLYCLIYARIPFMAEDEFQLFRAIANEEVYIPRRRLKAVDPSCSTSHSPLMGISLSTGPYREEGELAFEDIDEELYDLLRRMLIKDPAERIKLREVKRHPWVIRDINDIIGWLEDSDPSRMTAGRRIQVDDRDLERAVIPITLLERARSAVKTAIGKVMGVKALAGEL
jgi:[calcium/calmodulin-dependent protein kinase] kinase